jgi:hypothetical protein
VDGTTDLLEEQRIVDERRRLYHLERLTPINPNRYTRMEWLWDNLKTQDYAFDDFGRGDVETFAMSLLDSGSLHFEFGEAGYAVVRNLRFSDNPSIHFCVWDRSVPFREILSAGRELVDFLFTTLKVARVTASCPVYNKQASKFAMMLGFKFEGVTRNGILFHEKHHNVEQFGILRNEWEKKNAQRPE